MLLYRRGRRPPVARDRRRRPVPARRARRAVLPRVGHRADVVHAPPRVRREAADRGRPAGAGRRAARAGRHGADRRSSGARASSCTTRSTCGCARCVDRIDIYFWAYAAVNALYLAKTLAGDRAQARAVREVSEMRPTRAILIAAGRGQRLGAHTEEIPKCMVEVGAHADPRLGVARARGGGRRGARRDPRLSRRRARDRRARARGADRTPPFVDNHGVADEQRAAVARVRARVPRPAGYLTYSDIIFTPAVAEAAAASPAEIGLVIDREFRAIYEGRTRAPARRGRGRRPDAGRLGRARRQAGAPARRRGRRVHRAGEARRARRRARRRRARRARAAVRRPRRRAVPARGDVPQRVPDRPVAGADRSAACASTRSSSAASGARSTPGRISNARACW